MFARRCIRSALASPFFRDVGLSVRGSSGSIPRSNWRIRSTAASRRRCTARCRPNGRRACRPRRRRLARVVRTPLVRDLRLASRRLLLGLFRLPRHPWAAIALWRCPRSAPFPAICWRRRASRHDQPRALLCRHGGAHHAARLESADIRRLRAGARRVRDMPSAGRGARRFAGDHRRAGGQLHANSAARSITGRHVSTFEDLPEAARSCSTSPRQAWRWRANGSRGATAVRTGADFRYGPGVFKIDWALDAPVPWAGRRLP